MRVEQAIRQFMLHKEAAGLAKRTIYDYQRVLGDFCQWLEAQEKANVEDIQQDSVIKYALYLQERGWKRNTRAIYLEYLRAFLRWLHRQGLVNRVAVPVPRKEPRHDEPITTVELQRLVHACTGEFAQRDRAIILTLADTGLRVGELLRLQRHDIHFEQQQAWMHIWATKTRNSRVVVVSETTTQALREYLASRQDTYPHLWVGRRGPLTYHGIRLMLRRRAQQASLPPAKFNPHNFRKFFATQWLASGGDVVRLQHLGGWRSPEMLKIYAQLAIREQLMEGHLKYSPVENSLKKR